MTCQEMSAVLGAHRAGELGWRLRLSVALHAALCPCCRAMMATYGLVTEVSGDLAAVEVPSAVAADVEALLEQLAAEKIDPG